MITNKHKDLDYLEHYANRYMRLAWKADNDNFNLFAHNLARWADFYFRAAQYARKGYPLLAAKEAAYNEQELGLHFNA